MSFICEREASAADPRQTGCWFGRYNAGPRAMFTGWALQNPFQEGHFKFVSLGNYDDGAHAIGKWNKTSVYDGADALQAECKAAAKAMHIVTAFNDARVYERKHVFVNMPEVFTITSSAHDGYAGLEILVEPFIDSFTKYNCNDGWCDERSECAQAMQALSHFSYDVTGGSHVLTDVQGGETDDSVMLTDVAILTPGMDFGPTDLGRKGIAEFFRRHRCNRFCEPHWKLPPALGDTHHDVD